MKAVYYIKNVLTGYVYIGSSQRFKEHRLGLRKGEHHCSYLQNSWTKHGESNFKFGIIEKCINLLEREQFYIDHNSKLYNSMKKVGGYHTSNKGTFKKGSIPWNKGKNYKSTDHLKVKKNIKSDRMNFINTWREKSPDIYVYDSNGKFLGHWRSAKDLEESTINGLELPVSGRFSKPRKGISIYILQNVNILKALREDRPYKGLIIKSSLQLKSDKLLEDPEEDNQQPIISLND
jgi:hypothetical protein